MKKPFRATDHATRTDRPKDVRAYDVSETIERAVNVALVCRRPLLLLGESGTGKSTLARYVAWCLGREYLEEVITSRTAADDLKWRFDAVRRLADAQLAAARASAQAGGIASLDLDDRRFVTPGVLWQALAPKSAVAVIGGSSGQRRRGAIKGEYGGGGAVVLLDEIDKADPDVPNDLLVTIDARWFRVPELDRDVEAENGRDVLLLLTSNQERDLPRAFVRRCILLTLPRHTPGERRRIAELHNPGVSADLLLRIDGVFAQVEAWAKERPGAPLPSTAEYLDAVRACIELGIKADARELDAAVTAALWKHGELPTATTATTASGAS